MRYETIDPMSREDVDAALASDDPEELLRVVLAVALHSQKVPGPRPSVYGSLGMVMFMFAGTRFSALDIWRAVFTIWIQSHAA